MSKFTLPDSFIAEYADKPVDWGYGALSETVFLRSYSQLKDDGTKERWYETCRRVIEATFDIQKTHCRTNRLPWNNDKAQRTAKDAYDRMFHFKWTPPGRGLARMGTPIIERLGNLALMNCSAVTTEEFVGAMEYLMDASLLGVGVGYDTAAAGKYTVRNPFREGVYVVPDSREGWVESTRKILMGYMHGEAIPEMDYSEIRPSGRPISSGGTAPGPDPLITLHKRLHSLFEGREGDTLTIADVVDVGNCIGAAVVAGGNRRTALIALDDSLSNEFLDLKNLEKNPYRADWAWASNNSVKAKVGQDLSSLVEGIKHNGEPGVVWEEMLQNYGRLIDPPDYKEKGQRINVNPCGEIGLTSTFDKQAHKAAGEGCNLTDVNMNKHETLADFLKTIKVAFLYNKTVTLMTSHIDRANAILLKNRRIGLSLGGVANFVDNHSMPKYREWADSGYKAIQSWDTTYSEWLCVRESIRTTTLKPSGSTSSLCGESPGVHWSPGGAFYVRRVNFTVGDPILDALKSAGYPTEKSAYVNTFEVVEFPVKSEAVRADSEVSAFEKMYLAAETQAYWADNAVSCTVSFDPEAEGDQIGSLLQMFDGKLKGISFLPRVDGGAYKQMPYESITEDEYNERMAEIGELDLSALYGGTAGAEAEVEAFCSNDSCEAPLPAEADNPNPDRSEFEIELVKAETQITL